MFDKDIVLKGKHATYLKFLSSKTEKNDPSIKNNAAVFSRHIDVYIIGALIGVMYNRKAHEDISIEDKATIFLNAISNEQANIEFVFHLCMICDNTVSRTNDEKVNYAFRQEELNKEKEDLFNDYVRGGIEFLYEFFTDGADSKDDYYQKIIGLLERIQPNIDSSSIKDII